MSPRVVLVILSASLVLGCGSGEVPLEGGSFTRVYTANENQEMSSDPTVILEVDLATDQIEILVEDESSHTLALERVDESEWLESCHTMRGMQRLEWARLDGPLTLAGATFEQPILMTSCHGGGSWMVDGMMMSHDRALQLGEEDDLVHMMHGHDEYDAPLLFMPTELLQ